jgi:hypothetical protein
LKRCLAFKSTCCVCAISLSSSWMTARSLFPTSLCTTLSQPKLCLAEQRRDGPRCDLNMEVALHDVQVQSPTRRRHENALVNFELYLFSAPQSFHSVARTMAHLFDTRPEDLAESCADTRLLACAGRTVEQHMREVSRCGLFHMLP